MATKVTEYMTPAEVARLFRVDPKTVVRWCTSGRMPADAYIRTLGGHRRFRTAAIQALLDNSRNGGRS